MFLAAILSFFTGFFRIFCFGVIGENITIRIRRDLYESILRKHIGWFDLKEHAPGAVTSVMASDTQTLNGVSSEGLAMTLESFCALMVSIVIGFSYSWRISLVSLGTVPFMMFGAIMNTRMQTGLSEDSDAMYKESNLLAGDAITNYRTVASFGNE